MTIKMQRNRVVSNSGYFTATFNTFSIGFIVRLPVSDIIGNSDGTESRHTVVCRAAQEAVASHREHIDRKTKNVIFTSI